MVRLSVTAPISARACIPVSEVSGTFRRSMWACSRASSIAAGTVRTRVAEPLRRTEVTRRSRPCGVVRLIPGDQHVAGGQPG